MTIQEMYNRVTRRGLADVLDDSRNLTVTKTLAFPIMSITSMNAPSEALPGALIDIQVYFSTAQGDGLAWAQIFDADTGAAVSVRLEWDVFEGLSGPVIFTDLVMPDKDWNLTVRIGHVE